MPRRPRPPLLLRRPTRFADWPRGRARAGLATIALLLVACLTALATPAANGADNAMLHDAIVDGLRAGGNYYRAAADALRAEPTAVASTAAPPLPALPLVQAASSPFIYALLFYALAAGVLVAWALRFRAVLAGQGAILAAALLAGGLVALFDAETIDMPGAWSGLFVALSLASGAHDRWIAPAALGLCAMLACAAAFPIAIAMAALSLAGGDRRATAGWTGAAALFALVAALHLHAAAAAGGGSALAGWSGLHGIGATVRGVWGETALAVLPLALAAPLIGLAFVGWAAWDVRVSVALASIALAGVVGLADPPSTALTIAPLLLVGLVLAPDALRDLWHAALDTRRFTVTRGVR